jgi:ABC-type glycerol-3-phosphate transport system permease component
MAQAQAQTQPGVQTSARTSERPPKRPLAWLDIFFYIFLVIFTISAIGPLIFTFLSSFKTFHDILAVPPTLLPNPWTWGNYAQITSDLGFLRWVLNAFIYAIAAMILNVFFSAMAGYALARLNFPGKEFIFLLTLSVMMIPLTVMLIPKFLVMNSLHLVNTYFALILPNMAQPFSVFIMTQFMRGLPKELEESAMIDGASRWRTFYSIILPVVKPALTAVAIVTFQGAWNDFLWPLVVLGTRDMYTLPLGLYFFKSAHYTEYNLLIAGSMFNTIPIIILFFIFQRYFIEGATAAAVKG